MFHYDYLKWNTENPFSYKNPFLAIPTTPILSHTSNDVTTPYPVISNVIINPECDICERANRIFLQLVLHYRKEKIPFSIERIKEVMYPSGTQVALFESVLTINTHGDVKINSGKISNLNEKLLFDVLSKVTYIPDNIQYRVQLDVFSDVILSELTRLYKEIGEPNYPLNLGLLAQIKEMPNHIHHYYKKVINDDEKSRTIIIAVSSDSTTRLISIDEINKHLDTPLTSSIYDTVYSGIVVYEITDKNNYISTYRDDKDIPIQVVSYLTEMFQSPDMVTVDFNNDIGTGV